MSDEAGGAPADPPPGTDGSAAAAGGAGAEVGDAPTGADPRLHRYIDDLFAGEDALLAELREELDARGFPTIQVPGATGRLLHTLVAALAPQRILEVGTLGGYSAIWMGRALGDGGRIVTLELDLDHAALAREFIGRAGLADRVEVRVGDARQLLPEIGPDGSFDVVFLDADKESYPAYLTEAERLLRPGGVVMADNALWSGKVLEDGGDDSDRGIRSFNRLLAESPAWRATIVPVGDGVALGVKR